VSPEVAVVGAGIAGLAAATELAEAGRDVVVLEAAPRAGGVAETARRDGLLYERGPSTVRATPALERLAALAKVELLRAARAAPYLCAGGKLLRVPPSFADLASGKVLPPMALLGLLAEPFRPRLRAGAHSVADVLAARLGAGVADRLADVLTLGIYGARASEVGFEAAFPTLAEGLARHGSFARLALARIFTRARSSPSGGLVSTPAGLDALTTALADRLGPRLRLGCAVRSIEPRDAGFEVHLDAAAPGLSVRQVILAVPPSAARSLVVDPEAARLLGEWRSAPQALAIFALRDAGAAERWPGFGFLVPGRERLPILGGLFVSQLFPGRAPPGTFLVTTFLAPELHRAPEAAIQNAVGPLLARLLASQATPALVEVARHPVGIPLYDPGHPARLAALRARLARMGGPLLAGSGYDGVAFGASAASGVAAARLILDSGREHLATSVGAAPH
jgi:oxygen-dependent protoporphyrinogen oxidase